MRKTNWLLVIVGGVLIALAIGFFLLMLGMAGKSNDPQTMLQTSGEVSGAVGGIAVVMVILGLMGAGRKA